MKTFKIEENNKKERLDKVLSNLDKTLSRTAIQRLIEENKICVNNKKEKASYKVSIGDIITIEEEQAKEIDLKAQDIPVEVLYEDNDILVAVKPYGLPSQPDKKNSENMVSMLKLRIFEKEHRTEEPYLAPIHRLDRPVGGIMLFAKNKEAASKLSKQSEDGEMVKYYQAILTGELPNDAGTITNYLIHDNKTNVTRIVDKDTPGAKLAELDYEVLDVMETDDGILSYVLINLITGRTHQIRVQMAGKKAGIWGDTKYNPKFQKTKKSYKQIGLHASRLEFEHPVTGEHMIFKNEPEGKAFEIIELDEF